MWWLLAAGARIEFEWLALTVGVCLCCGIAGFGGSGDPRGQYAATGRFFSATALSTYKANKNPYMPKGFLGKNGGCMYSHESLF